MHDSLQSEVAFKLKGVTTVTLNPAVDVFLSVDTLEPGTLHRVPNPLRQPGGKGINVSKLLAELGVPTVATGLMGGARGTWLEDSLRSLGVNAQFTRISSETRMNIKVNDKSGRLTEFNAPAPAFTSAEWAAFNASLRTWKGRDQWLALCGNLPQGCQNTWYREAIEWAKSEQLFTLLDASGEAFERGIEAKPDVIKPNVVELGQLLGRNLQTVEEVMAAAGELARSGIRLTVVSMGDKGLAAVTSNRALFVRVPSVPVVSTVGAGDTVVAGLLYGFYRNDSFDDTIRFAAAAGTAKVQQPGTRHPSLAQIEDCLAQTVTQDWGVSHD